MFQLWFGGFSREGGNGGRQQPSRRRGEDNLCNFSVQCVCLIVRMLMYECEVLLQIGSQAMQV